MSADSPRRVHRKGNAGHIVLPQPVNDPSLIESVTGFIQEVVPQAYSGSGGDGREVITWARIQQADINDPAYYPDTGEQDGVPPLLLVLGYGSGVQVWCIPISGEAREVLSWSQGVVRSLVVLPKPELRLPLRQDPYKHKRPLVAMVDNAGPGPQFCAVSFISVRDGDQVKSIKFSHQVWDVVANKRSVVVTLAERIAVFDAATLEDNLAITTCYPSPDVNPIALGTRWLAYADRRLVTQWRSLGGCQSEGPQSVTATVFHAAKALGKGLRDLSGTVASSLTGSSPENTFTHTHTPEPCLKGVVTILDVETKLPRDANEEDQQAGATRIVAHFNAHFEPIVALSFDPSGLLLLSADKRGHRFHVFRINPHPCGSTLTFAQHLYILHRGDTTARIQDIVFSADSRWVAISSMRGTTHVFPITPYGGPVGVRTHTTPHVVNKLSRFQRSAGLSDEGRNSPVLWDGAPSTPPGQTVNPMPTTVPALAQVRRHTLSPPTEDSVVRVAASFGAPRAPALAPHSPRARNPCSAPALFVMACSGSLIQYDLEPRHSSGVSKEKVCDETGVELHIEARAEWVLQRPPYSSSLHPPLPCTNPLLCQPDPPTPTEVQPDDERWLSQVEIVTHAGPHRRLWMGPQFTFVTVNSNNEPGDMLDISKQVVRSSPVNMPLKQPLIIESGSCSSLELSPNLVELVYKTDCSWSCRLREDLAEAMMESPSSRNTGIKGVVRREPVIERQVNPLGSVVTLTAQLNFPADLLTDEGKVTVIGTETKKITLESRFNKPITKSLLNDCSLSKSILDPCLKSHYEKKSDLSTSCINLVKSGCKSKEANCDLDVKGDAKVLTEVNENISISNPQKRVDEREAVLETLEKKGKNGKNKRKISKVEKNKIKVDIDSRLVDEPLPLTTKDDSILAGMSISSIEIDDPVCEGILLGTGDIEMQLREASLEKDLEVNIHEAEDCKGRKRSLDTNVDMKASTDELIIHEMDINKTEELKENDKVSLRSRKKSKTSDQDVLSAHRSPDTKKNSGPLEEIVNDSPEKVNKFEEKGKGKKKKTKKSNHIVEPVGEIILGTNSSPSVQLETSSFEVIAGKVSLETHCLEICQDSFQINVQNGENQLKREMCESLTTMDDLPRADEERELINTNDKVQILEEKSTTDDELKGFESDLLVKESNWSPEKSPEKDTYTLIDDKDSDKDNDKVKNEETTDKDSSDDCQPVLVKFDSKHAQKRGKNRKLMRKSREADSKMSEVEIKPDENFEGEDAVKLEKNIKKEENERKLSLPKVDLNKEVLKVDSEEEDLFIDAKKNQKEIKFGDEVVADVKVSLDGIKRRIRKKETQDKEKSEELHTSVFDVPKRSWSSVVALSCEDPNGNVSKPEDSVPSVKSWSTVASAPAKLKGQDVESAKTNSVEDRDSVYESCNDSVGEELEPALDSLGSCYYEPETKDEAEDTETVFDGKIEEASSESKHGSSVEEKSNTDSGEKEELLPGVQTSTKKSKKQKKKKR